MLFSCSSHSCVRGASFVLGSCGVGCSNGSSSWFCLVVSDPGTLMCAFRRHRSAVVFSVSCYEVNNVEEIEGCWEELGPTGELWRL